MKWGWSKREKESRDGREEGKIEKQEDGGKRKRQRRRQQIYEAIGM